MDPLTGDDVEASASASLPERVLLALAMVGICLLCLTVTITVVSRAIYTSVIPDEVLIVREIMVAAILIPLAAVTAARAHIAVTVFTDWTGRRSRRALSIFAHVFGLVFAGWLLIAGYRLFVGAWQSGEYYDGDIYIPMWIGYATFVLALLAFALRLIAMVFSDIKALRAGR